MKAFILAGGFGIRLRKVAGEKQKVMAPVKGRPFLEYMIFFLRKNGVADIIIAAGYSADQIIDHFGSGKNYGVNIDYSIEDSPLGTGGAIKHAESKLKREKDFLVFNGDTYFELDLGRFCAFHQTHPGCASITLRPLGYGQTTRVEINSQNGKAESIAENSSKEKEGLINAGVYLFNPEIFSFILPGKKISLEKEIFPMLVQKGELYGWEAGGFYAEIGTPERYKRTGELLPPLEYLIE